MTASVVSPLSSAQLLGFTLHLGCMQALLAAAQRGIENGDTLSVVTLNPEMMMKGLDNPAFGALLKAATLALPDGAGAVWALRRAGHRQQQRLPGIEFAEGLLALAEAQQWPVALVGASPEVLPHTLRGLQQRYPALRVAYSQHGFFGVEDSLSIAQAAAAAGPKVVLVALGVPRQEEWIAQHKALFEGGCALVGVGGSFDVWGGNVQRAPALLRQCNLEWAWRLACQPWRIQRSMPPLLAFVRKVLYSPPAGL